jgi:hypothetical protein
MLVVSVLLVAALSKRDVAGMTDMAELDILRSEDLDFTLMSGVNNLCLFNSFAHGTSLDPVNLRRRVCAFMQANPTTQVSDIGMNVSDFVAFEGSTMNQLNERVLQRDGAGLTVAGSLATMLGRNVEVYQRKIFEPGGAPRVRGSDAYVQILKTTVDPSAPILRLRFSPGGTTGHYDIINFKQAVPGVTSTANLGRRPVSAAQPVATFPTSKATSLRMPKKARLTKKHPSKEKPANGTTRGAMSATRQRITDVDGVDDDNDVRYFAAS